MKMTEKVMSDFVRGHDDRPGILEQLAARFQWQTPDFLERKLEGVIPVFVYGTLRRGFHNHHLLKGLPYLGSGYTTVEKYELRDAGQGSFPVAFEKGIKQKSKKRNQNVGKIRGEIFAVDPKTLLSLDRLENNGGMYTRSLQYVFLEEQRMSDKSTVRPSIKAWMYLGNETYWQGRGAFDTLPSRMQNGVRFYDWAEAFEKEVPWDEIDDYQGYLKQ